MKKIVLVLTTLMLSMTACGDWQNIVGETELPLQAQNFIKTHFSMDDVARVEVEREKLHLEYQVYLNNGTELDFDMQGNFVGIDCQTKEVPAGIVPEVIEEYVKTNYAGLFIMEYNIEKRYLQVELNNGAELIFDLEGKFLRVDD